MNKPEPMSEADIRRCYDAAHGGVNIVSSLSDFSRRVARAIEAERDAAWAARLEALQAENDRFRAAGRKLEAALSRIDYFCGEPNEMGVSGYDVLCDEDVVIQNVAALAARLAQAERDARRYRWLRAHYSALTCGAHGMSPYVTFQMVISQPNFYTPAMLDAAIGAAITKEQP